MEKKKQIMAKLVKDLSENKDAILQKPIPPIEPKWEDYPTPKEPNGKNYLGQPLYQKLDWVKDKEKYNKDLKKYQELLEVYEQLKLIRFIKNADEKLILRKYKITKK